MGGLRPGIRPAGATADKHLEPMSPTRAPEGCHPGLEAVAMKTNKIPMALAVLAIASLAGAVLFSPQRSEVPECTLLLGPAKQAAEAFAEAAPETEVRVELRVPEALHAYVASWSETDGTLALLPTPWLQTSVKEPLPSGSNLLPGQSAGKELAWLVPPVPGLTHVLVVASRTALPDLEATFAVLRQASNTTFPDGRMVITAPRDHHMSDVPARNRIAHPLLEQAAAVTGMGGRTPMRAVAGRDGVWVTSFQLVPPPAK
jgi:hypothetical protein